ncbi:MAG: type II toxin-antitoxin system RelE/ParE family toxin [Xanthobacteraceae bacterium]
MLWIVRFEDEFEQEFLALEQEVQDELLAVARLLAEHGPQLGRPYVDTLKGSKHTNMRSFDSMR